MSNRLAEQPNTTGDTFAKTAGAMGSVASGSSHALTASSAATMDRFHELSNAYQALFARNAERMANTMKELAAVRSPAEFMEVQRKLLSESMQSAVADGTHIAQLSAAMFSASFQPVQSQIESLRNGIKN